MTFALYNHNDKRDGMTAEDIPNIVRDIHSAATQHFNESQSLKRISKMTRVWYALFAAISACIIVIGVYLGQLGDVIIAVPTLFVTVMMLIYDKEFIHVPPMLIFIIVLVMILSLVATVIPDPDILAAVCAFLSGVVLSLTGLIVSYVSLGKRPGFVNEKPAIIAIEAFTFGLALFMIWMMTIYYLPLNLNTSVGKLMADGIWVTAGCLFTTVLYVLNRDSKIISVTVDRFLTNNSTIMGISVDMAEETKNLIDTGESGTLEFKSTLMTNLQTGEPDKRMEKAVLKTISAFLNTNGGTLLVGVEDDGNIRGVDIERFENRDKMNLHITNIIAAQIGNEFVPFIRFEQVDYGKREDGNDKIVVRFDCTPTSTPAFLKNTKEKTETFFIRSGPSSVEITGNDLINYVMNRRKTSGKRLQAASGRREL